MSKVSAQWCAHLSAINRQNVGSWFGYQPVEMPEVSIISELHQM